MQWRGITISAQLCTDETGIGTNPISSIFLVRGIQKVDLMMGWFDSVVYVVTDDKDLNMKLFEMQSP